MILLNKSLIWKITPRFLKVRIKMIIKYMLSLRDFYKFKKFNDTRFELKLEDKLLCLNDLSSSTSFDAHYVYHTAWAARILAKTKLKEHYDIGSCLRFVAIASAFIPFKFYDFRPADLKLSNLKSGHADLTKLPFRNNSIKSLSCMHVLEHIGLGRYGDSLDAIGDLKGAKELTRVLARGGQLLFAVPISGKPRIQFNAHRIYSYEMVLEMFTGLKLKMFSLIPDNALKTGLIENDTKNQSDIQNYGCGCFWFIKE